MPKRRELERVHTPIAPAFTTNNTRKGCAVGEMKIVLEHMRAGSAPRALLATAGLALVLLALAACEAPGVPHPLAAQTLATPQSTEPPPTSQPGSGHTDDDQPTPSQPTPTQTPEPLQETAQVSLKDFQLDPDVLSVKAGTVTFVLTNEGRFTHDFRVRGQGIDDKAPKVGRGKSREWQIELPPGTYEISCPISNHADRGMVGTLMVGQ